jgi:8-oxo-dGTP diphosphatase
MEMSTQRHSVSGVDSLVAPAFFDQLVREAKSDGVNKVLAGAIIKMGDEVLIVKRAPTEDFMQNIFEIPSGHVEDGEDLIAGLVREVQEETALNIKRISAYAGSFDYTTGSGKFARQFNFVVDQYDGEVSLNPVEHSEYRFIRPDDQSLHALAMSAETKRIIREYGATLDSKD